MGNPAAYKIVRSRVDVGGEGEETGQSDEDESKVEKKKKPKKKAGIKKATKGNFTSFRNKTT